MSEQAMIPLSGKYSDAKVFTYNIDNEAVSQIINICNQSYTSGLRIRIMPDVHAGAGAVVGFTMTVKDKVVPALVGSDIGCGMETWILSNADVDLPKLDKIIREYIPSGHEVRKTEVKSDIVLGKLKAKLTDETLARLSLGTLGGGNHFIELDRDENGKLYLAAHSGSRYLGKQVAQYYQNLSSPIIEGSLFDNYLHDMIIAQQFAAVSRQIILREICDRLGLKADDAFTTIHNYIDTDAMILRKGAISAKNGERVLIPLNMRDGSLICIGRGNADWNFSAPHGAGRLMRRGEAKKAISLADYRETMKGIYSSSVNQSTIDESPFAYKPFEEIMSNIEPTATIDKQIMPLYNFKASVKTEE